MRPAFRLRFECNQSVKAAAPRTSDTGMLDACRDSLVPAFATSASSGFPAFTINRYVRPSITGSTYASFPFFVDSMKVEASGTSTSAKMPGSGSSPFVPRATRSR